MYILIFFFICAIIGLISVGMYYHSKIHAIDMICNHPELSDEKVKTIAEIMTNQHKWSFDFLRFIKFKF